MIQIPPGCPVQEKELLSCYSLFKITQVSEGETVIVMECPGTNSGPGEVQGPWVASETVITT